MTVRARASCAIAAALLACSIAAGIAAASEASNAGLPEVLDLAEASELLRVTADELAKLAAQRQVPGRRIAGQWRFSRAALLIWLGGVDPEAIDAETAEALAHRGVSTPDRVGEPMAEAELAALYGRGPDGAAEEGEAIGEAPVHRSASDIFLRRQRVLLGKGQFIIEPSVFYSTGERSEISFIDFRPVEPGGDIFEGGVFIPGLTELEEDAVVASLGVRYGLFDETELFARGRFQWQEVKSEDPVRDSSDILGGIHLGVRRTVVEERSGVPDVVLSVEGYIPFDDSSYAVGGAAWLIKSFDPVVLLAGFEYRHTFSRNFSNVNLLEPEDIWGLTLGYSFAINDELSLNSAVTARFIESTDFSDRTLLSDEVYSLRLGLTQTWRPGYYLEPSVTFGLKGPASFVSFGLSAPVVIGLEW